MTLLIIITPFVIKGSSQRRCQAESGSKSGAKDNTGELSNLSLVSLKYSVLINLMDLAAPSIYSADSDLFNAQSADITECRFLTERNQISKFPVSAGQDRQLQGKGTAFIVLGRRPPLAGPTTRSLFRQHGAASYAKSSTAPTSLPTHRVVFRHSIDTL